MKKHFIKIVRDESGQVLPLALILLLFGGLLIIPSLGYAATNLNSGRAIEENISGLYAADAGIEHSLWRLENNPPASFPYSYSLPQLMNGLTVSIQIERLTTIYGIVVGSPGVHSDWMEIDGSMVYDEELGVYVYTITITNKHTSNIHLDKIIVMLPEDFEYAGFASGITSADPDPEGDPDSGITLIWDFDPPRPVIDGAPDPEHGIYTTAIQTFRLNGPPGYTEDDDYTWIVAQRQDIGCVGEANAYKITAQAKDGEIVITTIEAGTLKNNSTSQVLVSSWEITP